MKRTILKTSDGKTINLDRNRRTRPPPVAQYNTTVVITRHEQRVTMIQHKKEDDFWSN